MKCRDFEKVIPQIAGNGLIDAGTHASALRHAETCARCAARLAEERALISGLRAVRAEIANEEAPAHLETLLLNAFRDRARTAAIVPMPQRNRSWASWKVAGIAAAILLSISIGSIVLVRSLSNNMPPQPKAEASPSRSDSPAVGSKSPDARDLLAASPTSRRRTKPRPRRAETVTEFFPLIEGDDLESLEYTQIVRVELTPSALREVGLPMSYASEGDSVKADVILGHDGLARAIRFVR